MKSRPSLGLWPSRPRPTTMSAPYSARYYAMLGPPPAPDGGVLAAREYHVTITTLLELPPDPPWTRVERKSLQRLETRWRARATGEDRRWLLVGAVPGRLPKKFEDTLHDPDPSWEQE